MCPEIHTFRKFNLKSQDGHRQNEITPPPKKKKKRTKRKNMNETYLHINDHPSFQGKDKSKSMTLEI